MKSKVIYLISLVTIIMALIYGVLEFNIIKYRNSYSPVASDGILILGNSLVNGTIPSTLLESRLEKSVELYKYGYAKKIIVSGGKGPKDETTVALAMKKWLLDKNIPEIDIILEEKSKNTYENLYFSKIEADKNNLNSIIIITNGFHMLRAITTSQEFFNSISGAKANYKTDIKSILYYLKEPFSIIKYNVYDKKSLKLVNNEIEEVTIKNSDSNSSTDEKKQLINYDVKLSIDLEKREVVGEETIEFTNVYKNNLEKIVLNVNYNRISKDLPVKPEYKELGLTDNKPMIISEIFLNNLKLDFKVKNGFIEVLLPKKLKINEKSKISVYFSCSVPKIPLTCGGDDNNIWLSDFLPAMAVFKNNEFQQNRYLNLVEQTIFKPSNYNVEVITNENVQVIGNGESSTKVAENAKTTTFNAKESKNFFLVISNDLNVTEFSIPNKGTIKLYHKSEYINSYELLISVSNILNQYSEYINNFPMDNFTIVEINSSEKSFISTNEILFFDSKLSTNSNFTKNLTYELGKQWFGTTILCDVVEESWVNTCLLSYISEELLKESNFENEYILLKENIKYLNIKTIETSINLYDDEYNYFMINKVKCKLMLYELEKIMGKEIFKEFVKKYFETYKNKEVTASEFIKFSNRHSKKDLTKFYYEWLTLAEIKEIN